MNSRVAAQPAFEPDWPNQARSRSQKRSSDVQTRGRSSGRSFGVAFRAAAPVAPKVPYERLTGPIRNQTHGLTVQFALTF
jgi:hypothetical protein